MRCTKVKQQPEIATSPYSQALELPVTSVSARRYKTAEHEDGRVKACSFAFHVLKPPAALSSATSTTTAGFPVAGGRKGIVRVQVHVRCREKKETVPVFLVVHWFLLILTITVVMMGTMRGRGKRKGRCKDGSERANKKLGNVS